MLFLTEKGKKVLSEYLLQVGKNFDEDDMEVSKAIETLNVFLNKKI